MAKRYKEEIPRKSASRYKEKNSILNKKKFIIFFVIILILVIGYFLIINLRNEEIGNEVKISESDKKISSDILVLNDLNNEIIKNLGIENIQLVKAHYKLENLETGIVNLFYKIDDKEIIRIDINIKDKLIEKAEKQENAEEISLARIDINISKDIKQYYEDNQKRLKPDEGKNILNIILTDEQIIINASNE